MLVMSNHVGRTPLDVAITKKHFEAALLIVKAGGKANQDESIKDVLKSQVEDPVIEELKELMGRDKLE